MNKRQIYIYSLFNSIKPTLKIVKSKFRHSKDIDITNLDVKNKTFPKEYEDLIKSALYFFPELKNTRIKFILNKRNTFFTMTAQINLWSLFSKQREYIVKININRIKNYKGEDFNATFIGILSHELVHIVDYESFSFFGLVSFLWKYIWPKSRRKIELSTDINNLLRGSGYFMHTSILVRLKDPLVPVSYKRIKNKYYLRDDEILDLIKKV